MVPQSPGQTSSHEAVITLRLPLRVGPSSESRLCMPNSSGCASASLGSTMRASWMSPLAPSVQVFHRPAKPHGLPSARLECHQTTLPVSQQGPTMERQDDAELAVMPGTFVGRLLAQPFTARVAR